VLLTRIDVNSIGSALAVILFLFCLVVALLYQRFVLRRDTEGAVTAYGG